MVSKMNWSNTDPSNNSSEENKPFLSNWCLFKGHLNFFSFFFLGGVTILLAGGFNPSEKY